MPPDPLGSSHLVGCCLLSQWGGLLQNLLTALKIVKRVSRAHMLFGQHQDTGLWNN